MEHFEGIVKTALERDGYWVRQSFKVNLSKPAKAALGKPSLPRPEVDLLAFKPTTNELLAIEVKSYFDSPGVSLSDISHNHATPEGRYKLLTCARYRDAVFAQLSSDVVALGLVCATTPIRLGFVFGNVKKADDAAIRDFLSAQGYLYWSPSDIKARIQGFAKLGYENDPAVIAAKVLLR